MCYFSMRFGTLSPSHNDQCSYDVNIAPCLRQKFLSKVTVRRPAEDIRGSPG